VSKRRTGFALIEVVISLGLGAIALWLAADLLMEAQVGFVTAARQARAEEPRLLAASLRRDFGGAQGVVEPSTLGAWSSSPLTLAFGAPASPSGWARYRRAGDRIERVRLAPPGSETGSRPLLGAVRGWSWREVAPGLFEFAVVYEQPRLPRWGLRLGPAELAPGVVPQTLRLMLGVRGVGGGW
jgi:hypothetical protein